eukprot:4520950-Prymnesium_polylepis.1
MAFNAAQQQANEAMGKVGVLQSTLQQQQKLLQGREDEIAQLQKALQDRDEEASRLRKREEKLQTAKDAELAQLKQARVPRQAACMPRQRACPAGRGAAEKAARTPRHSFCACWRGRALPPAACHACMPRAPSAAVACVHACVQGPPPPHRRPLCLRCAQVLQKEKEEKLAKLNAAHNKRVASKEEEAAALKNQVRRATPCHGAHDSLPSRAPRQAARPSHPLRAPRLAAHHSHPADGVCAVCAPAAHEGARARGGTARGGACEAAEGARRGAGHTQGAPSATRATRTVSPTLTWTVTLGLASVLTPTVTMTLTLAHAAFSSRRASARRRATASPSSPRLSRKSRPRYRPRSRRYTPNPTPQPDPNLISHPNPQPDPSPTLPLTLPLTLPHTLPPTLPLALLLPSRAVCTLARRHCDAPHPSLRSSPLTRSPVGWAGGWPEEAARFGAAGGGGPAQAARVRRERRAEGGAPEERRPRQAQGFGRA